MSEEVDPPSDAERAAALEAKLTRLETSMREAAIRAELKTEAVRAGMVDLDWLRLIDVSAMTLDEAGQALGAGAVVAGLKRDKPWLFAGGSSSSAAQAPPSQPPQMRKATEMSYAEWQAARKELLRRR